MAGATKVCVKRLVWAMDALRNTQPVTFRKCGGRKLNRGFIALVLLAGGAVFASPLRADEVWHLDGGPRLGGHAVNPVGAPRVIDVEGGKALAFDGAKDGLFVPTIPIAGADTFTLEVLFSPAPAGPEAQRFFHLQDTEGRRALMEIRTNGKDWWLDAFLHTNLANGGKGLALIDPHRTHPTGKWYWVAMRYDGKTLADFVNGTKELEGPGHFAPLGDGKISLGVRQNLVYWFKGSIREVRFHREALRDDQLQRVKE